MSASRTTARLVATCLAAGALVGAAALPALADGHDHDRGDRHISDRGDRHGDDRHGDDRDGWDRHGDDRDGWDRDGRDHGDRWGNDHGRDRYPSVVIGSVQPGYGLGLTNRSLNSEWIEVRNQGRQTVNLNGYTLSDRDGNSYRFGYFRLEGGASVRVHTGTGRDTYRDVFMDKRHAVWDSRDTATLRDNRGWTIDTESWGGFRGR
ncbi:lamin tail domain-containing protein [Streptomyces sp. NPDC002004]